MKTKTKTYGKKWLIGLFGLLFLFLILPIEKVRAASSVEVGEWKLEVLDGNTTIDAATDYTWENSTLTIKSAKALSLSKKDGASNDPSGKVIIAGVKHTEEGARISFESISSDNLAIEVKDNSDVKLTFEGINITSATAPALKIEDGSNVKIHLGGGKYNTLTKGAGDFPIIEKGASGTLTIGGGGSLELKSSQNSGIGIGKKDGPVSNIEIFCKELACNETKIAIGSEAENVSNIRIKGEEVDRTGGVTLACIGGDCLIGSRNGQISDILISDSAIVSSTGQIKGERGNWNAMVFDKANGSEAKWRIYGNSFTLKENFEVNGGVEKFENNTIKDGQTFTVKEGVTLKLIGTTGFVNNGNLVVNGHIQGSFVNINQITGNGSIAPKLDTGVTISQNLGFTYTGQKVHLVKNQPGNYLYAGDGVITDDTFKWYKDENGAQGEVLGAAPKDVGTYHVGIKVAAGRFYAATAEATQKFEIKKADSQVLLSSSSNPAAVKKELSLTATVKGVNNEHPTGKVDFKIKKGSTVVKTENNVEVHNGKAVLKWIPEEKATYSVTAKYKPAADGTGKNYKESTSAEFSLTIDEKGSNPGGNSQGGGSSSGGGSSISGNSSSSSNTTTNTTKDNKSKEEKKEQDKKEKQKESKSVFKDVKTKDKSYQAIKFTVDKGLLKEKNHKFHPSKKITAKDVVSALYKMAGKAENKKVSDKKDLVKAEAFLKETKILSEKDGDFVKAKEITKEQLIQLLYNYAEYKGYNTEVTGKLAAFKDSNKLSKRAEVAMTWALENGLITDKNNKLSPKNKVTRKELATILYNFLNKEETKKLNK